jgi:PadR family transcriptional regulator PadR
MLKSMKQEGFVETYLEDSQSGAPRKYYRQTDLGNRRREELQSEWIEFVTAMFNVMGIGDYVYKKGEK